MPARPDIVLLRGLRFDLCVGSDAWGRTGKPQPVTVSLEIEPEGGLEATASGDDVTKTLDYGKLYKAISAKLAGQQFETVRHVVSAANTCIPSYRSLKAEVTLPKAALRASGGLTYILAFQDPEFMSDTIESSNSETVIFRGVRCACIIGVNSHEREQKQTVDVDLIFERLEEQGGGIDSLPVQGYQNLISAVVQRIEGSAFQTVEALATAIAQIVTMGFKYEAVTVRVEKPNAIATIEAAGVQLWRRRSFFAEKDFWQVRQGK